MNSIHRIGLAIAGVVAALTVASALVVTGYMRARAVADQAPLSQTATTGATGAASPAFTLPPETIYVNPAPTPVTITQTAPPGAQATPPVFRPGGRRGRDSGSTTTDR